MLALDALQPIDSTLPLHAAAQIAQRLAELSRQSGSFGFADMLQRLDDALDPERNGEEPRCGILRAHAGAEYPVPS